MCSSNSEFIKKIGNDLINISTISIHLLIIFRKEFCIPGLFPIVKKRFDLDLSNESVQIQQKSIHRKTPSFNLRASNSSLNSLPTTAATSDSVPNRKSTTSTTISNSEIDFEQFFKKSHPWQAVYLPKTVDKSFEDFLSMVIQNFVLNWYR